MAEHVSDGFDRRVIGQRPDGPGMTESSGSGSGLSNARCPHVTTHEMRDHQTIERTKRRLHREEQFPERGLVATVAEIMDERVTHRVHERQHHFLAALLRTDANACALPVNVVQQQLRNGYPAQTVSHHQNHDGIVPGPVRRIPINCAQHPFES